MGKAYMSVQEKRPNGMKSRTFEVKLRRKGSGRIGRKRAASTRDGGLGPAAPQRAYRGHPIACRYLKQLTVV